MFRTLSLAAVAALVVAAPVEAKRIAFFTPVQKIARADAVVVGKVGSIEKEPVSVAQFPNDPNKVDYKVAVVKVENGLIGADNTTHIKVGFIPAPPADPNSPAVPPGRPGRGGLPAVTLAEGTEGLFYLTKHHSGKFYTINPIMAPVDAKADDYKKQVELAKKAAAVLADPAKALKADKADDRLFAANMLVNKYRTYPDGAEEVENVKVGADESKLILKALAEGNWKPDPMDANAPNAFQAFSMLGLNEMDGWTYPMVKPGEDFIDKTKDAFTAWQAGKGKDYQVTKIVAKKK